MQDTGKSYQLSDKAVIEQLYEKYWKLLFAICYHKTEDRQVSEELVQDVFIGLWKRGGELTVTTSIKSYLIKSAKNAIMKHYRDKAKQKVTLTDEMLKPDKTSLQHNLATEQFLEEDLQRIVGQLPDQCQQVYRLSYEEYLSTDMIATQLELSPKTVKNHLSRALSLIRGKLNPSPKS